jgi:sugar lactone lactonase YvrE
MDVEVWHHGVPHDGLVRAADGTFWGAQYGTGLVVHYDADAAELETVELPAPNLTSVALDLDGTLYVASAREKLTEEQLEQHPLSGAIFALDAGTPGRPPHLFGTTAV